MSDNNAESFVDSSSSTLIDGFLQIGLFLGAIFQLICIFSVIFVPQKKDEIDGIEDSEQTSIHDSVTSDTPTSSTVRKREKKMRKTAK